VITTRTSWVLLGARPSDSNKIITLNYAGSKTLSAAAYDGRVLEKCRASNFWVQLFRSRILFQSKLKME
jgi:hypothetical protein